MNIISNSDSQHLQRWSLRRFTHVNNTCLCGAAFTVSRSEMGVTYTHINKAHIKPAAKYLTESQPLWIHSMYRNVMKLSEYFLYAKKTKITTLFNNLSPLRLHSGILENIRWAQTEYAVLCQPHHMDTSSTFI